MELINVKDSANLLTRWLNMPELIYQNDDTWIRPLDKDILEVFDPQKNKLFRKKEAAYDLFLLCDGQQDIGRIAVFLNPETVKDKHTQLRIGGFGFFECINNQQAANMLFDVARKWLLSHNTDGMDGSINFGERDRFWGILAQGFHEPVYGMFYHKPYYTQLFDNYGFKIYFRQNTYHRPVIQDFKEGVYERYQRIKKDPDYRFDTIKKNKLEQYAADFTEVFNASWGKIGTPPLRKAQVVALFNSLKPIMDTDVVWFAYYKGECIAFFLMMPDINQYFKKFKGQLGWWQKLQMFYMMKTGKCNRLIGQVFGIRPEYRLRGIDGAIIQAAYNQISQLNRYDTFEMNWIGDFHKPMNHVAQLYGGSLYKVHHTYRLLWKEGVDFERHPYIER